MIFIDLWIYNFRPCISYQTTSYISIDRAEVVFRAAGKLYRQSERVAVNELDTTLNTSHVTFRWHFVETLRPGTGHERTGVGPERRYDVKIRQKKRKFDRHVIGCPTVGQRVCVFMSWAQFFSAAGTLERLSHYNRSGWPPNSWSYVHLSSCFHVISVSHTHTRSLVCRSHTFVRWCFSPIRQDECGKWVVHRSLSEVCNENLADEKNSVES